MNQHTLNALKELAKALDEETYQKELQIDNVKSLENRILDIKRVHEETKTGLNRKRARVKELEDKISGRDAHILSLQNTIKEREAEARSYRDLYNALDHDNKGLITAYNELNEQNAKLEKEAKTLRDAAELAIEKWDKEKAKASARNAEKLEFMNQARLYLSGSIEKNALYNTIMKRSHKVRQRQYSYRLALRAS
jgi:chromosome segregation ATPase